MELGLAILFAIGAAWMYFTTPEQRQMIFGYIIFFTVIMSIIAFFTGQGPSSAYGALLLGARRNPLCKLLLHLLNPIDPDFLLVCRHVRITFDYPDVLIHPGLNLLDRLNGLVTT